MQDTEDFSSNLFIYIVPLYSWDEWVPENRVLKFNEANVQLQKETQKKVESSAKSTKKAAKNSKKAYV